MSSDKLNMYDKIEFSILKWRTNKLCLNDLIRNIVDFENISELDLGSHIMSIEEIYSNSIINNIIISNSDRRIINNEIRCIENIIYEDKKRRGLCR